MYKPLVFSVFLLLASWNGVKCHPRTSRVTELTLDGFSLSGRIGRGLLKLRFLHKLSLSNNNLTGIINHNLLLSLVNLKVVDLSSNALSGSLPDGFFRQCGSLRVLSLAKNKLTGKIPVSISSCFSLAALNFSSNHFSGSMPLGIWSLNTLRSFDLSRNELEGEFPEKIDRMNNGNALTVLNLAHNKLLAIVVGVIAITVLNLRVRVSAVSRSAEPLSFSGGDDFSRSPTTDCNSGKLVMFSGEPHFSTGTHALFNKDCELGRRIFLPRRYSNPCDPRKKSGNFTQFPIILPPRTFVHFFFPQE